MRDTETVLRAYLRRTLGVDEPSWNVRSSGTGGRGVFATRDLRPGELIYHDRPVVWGPRAKIDQPICASCHRIGRISTCVSGCFLPICSPACSTSPLHIEECRMVRETMDLPEGSWRLDLVGAVVALRCLLLSPEDREVVLCLQANRGQIHGFEVDLLKQHMKGKLDTKDEKWMRQCCLAMDTNAFEFIKVLEDGGQTSLRGLYPLAAIMNHNCSPNSSHVYDSDGIMRVTAARGIKAGEEITTSYTSLLWSTSIRRLNLRTTKHFMCDCSRCADPTEFGSMVSCLPCPQETCPGHLLPVQPLLATGNWFCGTCEVEVSFKQVTQIQGREALIMQRIACAESTSIKQFLNHQASKLHPHCQLIIQLKMDFLWRVGHKVGLLWQELSEELLTLKEQFCRDILTVLNLLKLGSCRTKGLILLELKETICEKLRREILHGSLKQELEAEILLILSEAASILHGDATVKNKLIYQDANDEAKKCDAI